LSFSTNSDSDLGRRKKFTSLRPCVVGKLFDQVFVGAAQHVGRDVPVREIMLIKVLDQCMNDFVWN